MITKGTKIAAVIARYVGNTDITKAAELAKALDEIFDNIEVMCYRDDKSVPLPKYGHYENGRATDACCDLICKSVEITPDGRIKCGTGLHVALGPHDALSIRPNSRITKQGLVIPNSVCTIDESYRGEIFVVYRPISENYIIPRIGDVLAQCHITHHPQIHFTEVDTLEELGVTERGAGGFGSTAKS